MSNAVLSWIITDCEFHLAIELIGQETAQKDMQ